MRGSQILKLGRDPGHAHLGVVLWSGRHLCLCQIWSGYLYSFKSYKGSQNFEIRSRDLGHAHLGVVLWPGHSRGLSCASHARFVYVSAKFEADTSIRSKVIRGPKISKWGRLT